LILSSIWDAVTGYFRDKPYWKHLQPVFALVSFYVAVQALAYQYLESEYRLRMTLGLYLRGYVFREITVVFAGFALLSLLFALQARGEAEGDKGRLRTFIATHGPMLVQRGMAVALVLALVVPALVYLSPRKVSHIRVKFLREPVFDQEALVYLLLELNKRQRSWYFVADFDTFNENSLTAAEQERAAGGDQELAYAEIAARGGPLIAITDRGLGEDSFAQHRGRVSVVSTARWDPDRAPSIYEYLLHSIIVQAILIHLEADGGALPAGTFRESRVAYGDLFQFSPRRYAIRSSVLAGHLTPDGERLLFNRFGAEYLSTCAELVSLEWMRSERVSRNLKNTYGVNLDR
jgi:fumarate reductase subunit C